MVEGKIAAVVSGSFKFKDRIDLVIEEFEDLGAVVLAPEKGEVVKERGSGFAPLKSEIHLPRKLVEDLFLWNLKNSRSGLKPVADLLYIVDIGGYIGGGDEKDGSATTLEMGTALANKKLVFAKEPIDIPAFEDLWLKNLLKQIPVRTVAEALDDTRLFLSTPGLYLPRSSVSTR